MYCMYCSGEIKIMSWKTTQTSNILNIIQPAAGVEITLNGIKKNQMIKKSIKFASKFMLRPAEEDITLGRLKTS